MNALALLSLLIVGQGAPVESAKRAAPPKVAPVTVNLERFEQNPKYPGYLFCVSAKDGSLLFIQQVYPQRITQREELDVQLVYFKTMKLGADGESLDIENERGEKFHVSIRAKERGTQWPATVSFVKRDAGKSLVVRLTIPNLWARPLRLDLISVAQGGRLENSMFTLRSGDKDLPYRGIMKKRAPPDESELIRVKPGETYSVEVELAHEYQVPPTGPVTVSFATFNHFADELWLVSNQLTIE